MYNKLGTDSFLASVPHSLATSVPHSLANLMQELKLLLGPFSSRADELRYCLDFTQAKPVSWSNPLKNLLRPLSEVPISAPPSDWPGSRRRGKEEISTQLIVTLEKETSGPFI